MERVERKWASRGGKSKLKKGWQRPGPGLPSMYRAEYAHMAEVHCRLGATNTELGDLFGVSESCIRGWIIKFPDFAAAVHSGLLDGFSPRVVRSLAQQAIGYSVDVEEKKVLGNGQVVKYTSRKYIPPNVTACIFWLKNRMPNEWHDVRDHVVEHQNLDKLSSMELLDEIRKEAAELGILIADPSEALPKPNGGRTTLGRDHVVAGRSGGDHTDSR